MSTKTQYTCSKCNQMGHNARTCGKAPQSPGVRSSRCCSYCHALGHYVRTCTALMADALDKIAAQRKAAKAIMGEIPRSWASAHIAP